MIYRFEKLSGVNDHRMLRNANPTIIVIGWSRTLQLGDSLRTSSNPVGSRRRSAKSTVELSATEAASASATATASSSRGTTVPRSSYSAAQQQRERWLSSATTGRWFVSSAVEPVIRN
jgi:hypothetical protein